MKKTDKVMIEIAEKAMAEGWQLDKHGRLYNVNDQGDRIRLRLVKQTLQLERKVNLTGEEKIDVATGKRKTWRNMKWEVLDSMGIHSGTCTVKGNKAALSRGGMKRTVSASVETEEEEGKE